MKIFAVALFVGLVAVARAASAPESSNLCYSTVTRFCEGGDPSKKGENLSKNPKNKRNSFYVAVGYGISLFVHECMCD